MGLDELVPGWQAFRARLLQQARILVVDDEAPVRAVLREFFAEDGFTVDTAESAEEAWQRIGTTRYDLLVTDKNLPGESGIDLIRRVTAAKLALPSMLITGYPSPETISEALLVGASDYLAKPFDMVHVQSRARTLLDRTLSALVFDRILRDLATLLQPPRSGGELFADLKGELGASQRTIDEALSVVLLDDLLFDLLALTRQLTAAGLRAKVHSAEAALELVVSASPPHAVVVDLARPEALALILALRTANPQVEVLAVTQEVDIVRALGAVQAGAADFVLIGVDDLAMITTRIRRIVARSRRRRMYLNLIAALHRRAVTSDPLLAGHFLSMVPPADERYIRERPAPGVTATDAQFDLDAYAER